MNKEIYKATKVEAKLEVTTTKRLPQQRRELSNACILI